MFVSIETKMPGIVIGEIPRIRAIANNEQLNKTKQRLPVAISGIALVIHDLLHGTSRANSERFEFNLYGRHSVNKEDHVITVVTIISIYSQLIDDFKTVLAPIPDVHQGKVEWCAVVALKSIALT